MTPRKYANAVLVVLFLAMVVGYGGFSLANGLAEGARHAVGDVTWAYIPAETEKWFSEHLALRNTVVTWHTRIKAGWLRVSPNPEVWLGRDGWLFYNQSAAPRAISPGDSAFPVHVDRWAQALSARRAWLADRGIKYLVVAAPDKQSIYPDYVPGFARRGGPSAFDQLLTRCARDRDLTVLDLRPALRSARPAGQLYWHTDTHWCGAGPYVAYAATATALGHWYPSLPPLPPTAFSVRPLPSDGGDLARLIGMAGRMPESVSQMAPSVSPHARPSAVLPEYQRDPVLAHVPIAAWDNDTPGLPRVVLLSDSFADDCYCMSLAEHCGRLVRVGSYIGQEELIERERPDVVIFEFVERIVESYSLPLPPAGQPPSLQHPHFLRVGK